MEVTSVPVLVRRSLGHAGVGASRRYEVDVHRVAPHAEILAGVSFRGKPPAAFGGVEPVVAGRAPAGAAVDIGGNAVNQRPDRLRSGECSQHLHLEDDLANLLTKDGLAKQSWIAKDDLVIGGVSLNFVKDTSRQVPADLVIAVAGAHPLPVHFITARWTAV